MHFQHFIGIDYSGADSPMRPRRNIVVYSSSVGSNPLAEGSAGWSRESVHEHLISMLEGEPALVGLDHGFSWPVQALDHLKLGSWSDLLDHVETHYACLRESAIKASVDVKGALFRKFSQHLRTTELRTTDAKPVFSFQPHGVSWSTLAGLPWISLLRREHGRRIHFWPFDGWLPAPGKHCVVEVYPTLFRRLYSQQTADMTGDERDAFCAAQWMRDMHERGLLGHYFNPPRTETESEIGLREGWILGVM